MLINITGLDGCGKSTQVKLLDKYIKAKGFKTFISKAYGTKEKAMFEGLIPKVHQKAILFLFQALHVQQFQKTIRAEQAGRIAIADRWDDSYIVYHTRHGILSMLPDLRDQLNQLAFESKKPNLTFLLDIPVNISHDRIHKRGVAALEKKSENFFSEMRLDFLELAKKENWIIVDGSQSIETVSQIIFSNVDNLLSKYA